MDISDKTAIPNYTANELRARCSLCWLLIHQAEELYVRSRAEYLIVIVDKSDNSKNDFYR